MVLVQQWCCHSKHHHTAETSDTSPWKRSMVSREHQKKLRKMCRVLLSLVHFAQPSSLSHPPTSNSYATCCCVFLVPDSLGPGLTVGYKRPQHSRKITGDDVAQPSECPCRCRALELDKQQAVCPLNATALSSGATPIHDPVAQLTNRVSNSSAMRGLSRLRCVRQRGRFWTTDSQNCQHDH